MADIILDGSVIPDIHVTEIIAALKWSNSDWSEYTPTQLKAELAKWQQQQLNDKLRGIIMSYRQKDIVAVDRNFIVGE